MIAGVYTVPGDGMVDFASVFRELPGYSGWVMVEAEQDPAKAQSAQICQDRLSLKKVLAETGCGPDGSIPEWQHYRDRMPIIFWSDRSDGEADRARDAYRKVPMSRLLIKPRNPASSTA